MKSLAFFGVYNPVPGGMSDYSEDLVCELRRYYDVTCYLDETYQPSNVERLGRLRPDREFRGREDRVLYQIGNSLELGFLLPHLLRHRGVVTLHDACQHDITYDYFRKHKLRFLYESLRSLDPEARRVLFSEPSLDLARYYRNVVAHYKGHPDKRALFPFSRFILRHADELIVHSRFLADYARRLRPKLPIHVLHHGLQPVTIGTREASREFVRRELGVPLGPNTLLFFSFGTIQEHKRITGVMEAVKGFARHNPDVLYLIVGPRDTDYDVDGLSRGLGIDDKVRVVDTYLPMEHVNECINASDLCFNLRYPSLGSTSGALYKMFAVGLPAVVTAGESMDEFPPDFTFSVPPPGEGEVEACIEVMRRVDGDRGLVQRMGSRARRFAEERCSWEAIAAQYEAILEGRSPERGRKGANVGGATP